jgi:hypothetical protein
MSSPSPASEIELPIVVPQPDAATVAIAAPGDGAGWWAGGASAVVDDDGSIVLAYRMRHPVGQGRGVANVIARSTDGVRFETICTLEKLPFDADSLERPWIVRLPDGRWRVYVSSNTPGTKHWKVEAIDADDPSQFDATNKVMVFPGDADWGVKDPVVKYRDGRWHVWLCCHPLERPEDADRMETRYGTSDDGISWTMGPTVLTGRPGQWDERGARVADVRFEGEHIVAYYDGCETAEQDTDEYLGIAVGTFDRLESVSNEPIVMSPFGSGSLRYPTIIDLPSGDQRLYYETTNESGAHELVTELVPSNAG